jgi:hypothetical protein
VFGPWYIILSFPLGALLALGRREEFLRSRGRPARSVGASIVWSPVSILGRLVAARANAKTIPIEARIWVAVFQIAGGIAAFGLAIYGRATGEAPGNGTTLAFVASGAFSIVAGGLLWRGTQAGLALSRLLPAMQVVRVSAGQFAFGLAIVPQIFTLALRSDGPDVLFGLGSPAWGFGPDASDATGVDIRVTALVLLLLLLVPWRPRQEVPALPLATVSPPVAAATVSEEPSQGRIDNVGCRPSTVAGQSGAPFCWRTHARRQ